MSNEAKFTKGEWIISGDKIGVRDNSDTQSYGMVKEVCWIEEVFYSDLESKANAYLIESAPRMYKKLDEISDYLLETGGIANTTKAREIENLLKEARGES